MYLDIETYFLGDVRTKRALGTRVNTGGQLEAELQLTTDVVGRQPAAQRVAHYPIPADTRHVCGRGAWKRSP